MTNEWDHLDYWTREAEGCECFEDFVSDAMMGDVTDVDTFIDVTARLFDQDSATVERYIESWCVGAASDAAADRYTQRAESGFAQ